MSCDTCVYYDPVDGYCVMYAAYVHVWESCDEHREPKKWLFLMDDKEGKYNADE